MEVFGTVAAGLTLGAALLKLGRKLSQMIASIRYARRSIAHLADEIALFAALYQSFMTTCKSREKTPTSICASFPMDRLTAWTRGVKRAFTELVGRVRALAGDPDYASRLQTAKAHVRWYFSKRDVECLRASLGVARESLGGFLNAVLIEGLDEQLRHLRAAVHGPGRREVEQRLGMRVEEAIENQELARDNHLELHLSHIARLQRLRLVVEKHRNDAHRHGPIVPDIDSLISYTDRVERCIVHVPPPRSFTPPSRSRSLTSQSPPRSITRPSHTRSFTPSHYSDSSDENSSAYDNSSSVTSRTDSTLSSVRSERRRARRQPTGERLAPSLNRITPSPTVERRVVTNVARPLHVPVVRVEGRTLWVDRFTVEMEDSNSAEGLKREIENDINMLTEIVRWFNGSSVMGYSSFSLGGWRISRR